ncbi:hypothetical protein F441_02141 [Phytophthora nicotianae CJ01A1]|uniref:Uncharacterized protein n=2 Tax=Phytophthora nicotianae TaxID=4792 RepID=W2J3X0_PHYNI|nr:hypothetical protein L915_08431 [Phytophthora nicotianae]ETL40457.1 hypothetical protein L916_08358 [Phytophthora nicotianae]ETL99386.1 hypothetical protein L917_03763 [Phytophthora nicotianae]ETP24946.1 hypothetical protein F441_02141 [Phytophthora nicotianae CJ01A1]
MSRQDETRPRPHFSSSPLEEREPPKSTGTQVSAPVDIAWSAKL